MSSFPAVPTDEDYEVLGGVKEDPNRDVLEAAQDDVCHLDLGLAIGDWTQQKWWFHHDVLGISTFNMISPCF